MHPIPATHAGDAFVEVSNRIDHAPDAEGHTSPTRNIPSRDRHEESTELSYMVVVILWTLCSSIGAKRRG